MRECDRYFPLEAQDVDAMVAIVDKIDNTIRDIIEAG